MSRSEVFFGHSRDRIPYAELQDCPDEKLVEEIGGGNADAFAVIFKRYHRLVHITALNIVRDAGEAEDMTQTVFLEIYRHLRQFDPARGTLKVWLLQFAYSRSMHRRNYLFVRQFHKQVELGEADARASHWSPSRLQPHSAAQGISRFTTCVLQSGIEIPYIAVKTNIAESLDVIVHIERRPGQRRVAEVLALRGFDPDLDKYNFDSVYHHRAESRHGQLTPEERQ